MKLKHEIALIIILTFALMYAITFIIAANTLKKNYLKFENQYTINHVHRVEKGIQQMDVNLDQIVKNAAIWDDLYQSFTQDKKSQQAFYHLVFNNITMKANHSDIAVILDKENQIIFSYAINPINNQPMELTSAFLQDLLKPISKGIKDIHGLVSTPQGMVSLAAHSILPTSGYGPSRGILLQARYFMTKELNQLREKTLLDVDLLTTNNIKSNPDLSHIFNEILNTHKPIYILKNDITLSAYSVVYDINHYPIALIKIILPRSIYLAGLKAVHYFRVILSIFCVAIVLIAASNLFSYFFKNGNTFQIN